MTLRDAKDAGDPQVEQYADILLLAHANRAMAEKLNRARTKGRGGWWDSTACGIDRLKSMLVTHVAKGDMQDVMNLAAMIHVRELAEGGSTSPMPTRGAEGSGITLTAIELRAALDFVAPEFDTDEDQRNTSVFIDWRSAGQLLDEDGKPDPTSQAGYVAWLAEHPEEGCIELSPTAQAAKQPT